MKAIYDASDNTLQEQSDREKPYKSDFTDEGIYTDESSYDYDGYEMAISGYNAHIASLRKLPCSPEAVNSFRHGEVYEEGVEYEIVTTSYKSDHGDFTDQHQIAVPLELQKGEDDVLAKWKQCVEESRRGFAYLVPGKRLTLDDYHKIYEDATFNFISDSIKANAIQIPLSPDPFPELLSRIATLFSEGKGNQEIAGVLREEWVISKK